MHISQAEIHFKSVELFKEEQLLKYSQLLDEFISTTKIDI